MESVAAAVLQQCWLPGLNSVAGRPGRSFSGWMASGLFQVYHPLAPTSATLTVSDLRPLCEAFAFESNRFSTASFESAYHISNPERLPKSHSWPLVQLYYAGFFAAHAIMRMFGSSCSQLNRADVDSIQEVADLFGMAGTVRLSRGFYRIEFVRQNQQLVFRRLDSALGGVHELFWREFTEMIDGVTAQILQTRLHPASDARVSGKLVELVDALRSSNCADGSWLSKIRNEINYRHGFGIWFPYQGYSSSLDTVVAKRDRWQNDPMTITIDRSSHELCGFQDACLMLLSFCRVLVEHMANRCPSGKSFHLFGPLGFLNMVSSRRPNNSRQTSRRR